MENLTLPIWPNAFGLLGYALALGLLIGLERGWTARGEAAGTRVAGFRTFGVLGFLGGVIGMLPLPAMAVGLAIVGGLLAIGYHRQSVDGDMMSATTPLTAVLTVLLGILATTGHPTEALATAATATVILSMRSTLHRWLRNISEPEIRSAMRLALITLVVLPLVPDRSMGPYGAWNPHQLWLVVIFVSGLSFVGYVATRRIGETRGILVTALCGAIVSSTAVTVSLARRLAVSGGPQRPLIVGIMLAASVMFVRVIILSAMLTPAALPTLAFIILPALLTTIALAGISARGLGELDASAKMELDNPLELKAALGLAVLVAISVLASHWIMQSAGEIGIAGVLALTGLADADAAILALAALPDGTLDAGTAGVMLSVPVLLNTLFKAGLTLGFAGKAGLRPAAAMLASVIVAGASAVILI